MDLQLPSAEPVEACAQGQLRSLCKFVSVVGQWITSACSGVGKRHPQQHKTAGTKLAATSFFLIYLYR